MLIAITRHAGTVDDAKLCEQYNHHARDVSPVRPVKNMEQIQSFIQAANRGEFDAIFFPSAFSAEKLGPCIDPRLATRVRMIANGPQTAKDLHNIGLAAEMLPFFYSRDLIAYLGKWIKGRKIGIPRADLAYMKLADDIKKAGGIPCEYKCYDIVATNEELDLKGCGAVLFTSPIAFKLAKLPPMGNIIPMAIGTVTADAMMYGGWNPAVIGDGSIEGTLVALNSYIWTAMH
ncbi:MAG TPA: uroporphyrinogen-III synthase [Methanocorpusculum sp.]|nr:uroporphyrinogen-III synthase [Methanocorpusculum sp.]